MYGVFGACLRSAPVRFSVFFILSVWYQWQWGGVLSLTSDEVALLTIKASIEADPQGFFSDWREGVDHCHWRGVGCDASGRVISLNITGRGLDLTDTPSSCGFYKLVHKAFGDTELPCLAYEKTVHQSGSPNKISDDSSFAACTLKGTLSPAVGDLPELRILSLSFNGFFGQIPKEVSLLKYLEHIDLQGNEFSGSLPSGLGQISRLKTLNVAHNNLQGTIPQEISSCRNLEVLNLSGNRLSGAIPTFFEHMPSLRVVALSSNQLFGTIPIELTSNCGRLEHLHLEDNYLFGKIPKGFGNCCHLQSLLLASNVLSGTIPPDIGQLQELQVLDVSRNSLGGNIPYELANCSHLLILVLTNNLPFCQTLPSVSVEGASSYQKGEYNYFSSIPTPVMALPNLRLLWAPGAAVWGGTLSSRWGSSLEVLNLASNSLTGSIPEELVQCKRLLYLDLSNNKLEGSLPSIPVHCLVVFNVSGNVLTGELPGNFSAECSMATLLDSFPTYAAEPSSVDNASFSREALSRYFSSLYCGVILRGLPSWFSDQGGISVVHDMSKNNFTGALQAVIIGDILLTRVPVYGLCVSDNQLTGTLSSSLFNLCQKLGAFSLKVSRNNFLGALPAEAISKCTSLKQFEAAGNQLNGIIPQGLGKLKHLVEIDLSLNHLIGELPTEVGELQQLQYYIVAENNLTGVIPESYGELSSLLVLDFSGNNLTGSIPENLAELQNLTKLLLSKNHLSGFVPENFTRLKYLSEMDVAFNNLSHTVRHSGNLESLCTNVSAESNELPKSCALSTPAPSNETNEEPYAGHVPKKNSHPNAILIAAITSGCAIAAVLIILLLVFHFSKQDNRVRASHRHERRHLTMFRSFEFEVAYENVVAATGNFSLNNLIGTGGFGATYKAEVSPGFLVAVKRLSSGRFQGTQQFEAEIRTLGRVQHPNLVTLFGYHASDNEKFLIYNFLPGGNLENLIHDPRRGSVSWRVRLRIALNIAQALAYLHDECAPRVLHRDIKPSNVLLDNNLNAFLSDFGLARLLSASETHATTDVAGTFGYVAPEYAMTCRLSEKADVYSYGVVLLELLSGKKALDPYFSKYGNGFNIVNWAAHFYRKGKPLEILAPGLWDQGLQSELTDVVKLAVRCTMTSLSVRPTMRQVVNILKEME
ncbi:hypothetical protein GOP47_0010000 [Adiantum capillus-veneris]|uniref:non-specific serine/threonine protein kinase n=1 Tax=Adiantum capillus-veneris TaxID=13818 RepID=A0A9D4ZHR9_ADICA|nr:hypothetical protein GOP47_0010000 [Adiantum capillus-veneris]